MRRGVVAAAVVGSVLWGGAHAEAQTLHSSAQVDYQHTDGARLTTPYETWGKSISLDWSRRIPGFDFSSRFRFNEQTVVGRQTRLRNPEGDVRLSHRYFGLGGSFRPSESRDDQGVLSRQQAVSLTGYVQKPGLPNVSGSWVRTKIEPSSVSSATSAQITRNVTAVYDLRLITLRASAGDRTIDREGDLTHGSDDSHAGFGATSQFRIGRVPLVAQYDFTQSRVRPTGTTAYTSRSQSAQASGDYALSSRTTAGFAYAFQRSESFGARQTTEHDGSMNVSHSLTRAVSLAASGGIRTAIFGSETRTERFVAASAAAQGQARPGWLMNAQLTHTQNWLPGESGRPAETISAGTVMRLSRTFTSRADVGLSSVEQTITATDVRRRSFAAHASGGFTAIPLRTLFLDGRISRNKNGGNLLRRGRAATTLDGQVRIVPSSRLSLSGGMTRVLGESGHSTTQQTAVTWMAARWFQLSGGYNHASQSAFIPGLRLPEQESYSLTVGAALAWRLNSNFRYAESNPHQSTHVRQYGFTVARPFGR